MKTWKRQGTPQGCPRRPSGLRRGATEVEEVQDAVLTTRKGLKTFLEEYEADGAHDRAR